MRKVGILAVLAFLILGIAPGHAHAYVIDFIGGPGGTLSYGGGSSPLVGTDLTISSVLGIPPGGAGSPIVGGELDFVTGSYSGVIDLPGDPFMSFFSNGGSFSIEGGVPGAGVPDDSLLLAGTFATPPVFTYSGLGVGSLSATLDVTFLNQALVDFFDFGSDPKYGPGVLIQSVFQVSFDGTNIGPTIGLTGTQNFVNVKAVVPQPVPLMLMGSGLVGMWLLGGWSRRRS